MGPVGMQEMVFIFVLALLIFGPKNLPVLANTLGKAMTKFRRAPSELKPTFDREISNLERGTEHDSHGENGPGTEQQAVKGKGIDPSGKGSNRGSEGSSGSRER